MNVSFNRGTEGPAHDPYGFDEVSVDLADGRVVVMHLGLDVWLKVNDTTIRRGNEKEVCFQFEELTGLDEHALQEMRDEPYRVPERCGSCGSGEDRWTHSGGYVGETIIACECGQIVWVEPVTDAMIQ